MAATLRDLDFEVIAAVNIDKTAFDQKLREFARALDNARTALFFYAGHGLQVAGKNYAIPIDARLESAADLQVETVDVDQVLSIMQSDEQRVNLVFLDACRDNPLTRSFAAKLPQTRAFSVGTGLSNVETGRGTLIAFATAPNKVAFDGGVRNSPFTSALLKHIRTPGLDIGLVMRRVTADVETASGGAQVPWMHASLTSDVILANAPSGSVPPAPFQAPLAIPPLVAPKVTAPQNPLPSEFPVKPEVIRLIETHPFFANAPPVSVNAYTIVSTLASTTRGAGTASTMTSDYNDETNVQWLRQGLVRLDLNQQYSVNNSGAKGNYAVKSTSLSAANGLFNLSYKMVSRSRNMNMTTTTQLLRLENMKGHIFPLVLGNKFSYDSIYSSSSSKMAPSQTAYQSSCEVTKVYDAKNFHSKLTGKAHLLVCDERTVEKKDNSTSNSQSHDLFFDSLGVWMRADPITPREQIVTNNQTSVYGNYTTTSNGTYTLKSFFLTP
jgi:hypothetical protein